ncbi:hypothetical protein DJ82_03435 [Halorubrum sp. Ib24]|uniref:hypothetical protein n=1 Tax=unclassified Halorubrum TaxID=2642239 RepID=UPI000B98F142|nr:MULTISPECIES: hypothetical protein [unclassified Halorubrum]OYR39732.1 hypothetical protein DJ81_15450 [Halorubrum sp. Hd13]OYR42109.1 hypothetical protein DJ82_03435 [Halorubrum sp. Ib24]OYR47678.1 hypothetical protein DJ74_12445 [Halorubrum sp. Ea8]OYR51135.1 hypothetical protein DJ73_13940 [Halorubrum sp. Ea1]
MRDATETSDDANGARRADDEFAGDRDGDDDAESTGPLARAEAAVTEAVGLVVDAVLDAI